MIQKRPRCSFAASSVVVGAIPVAPEMTREKHLKKKKYQRMLQHYSDAKDKEKKIS